MPSDAELVKRLARTHPDYEGPLGVSWWQLLRDAHDGAGGFRRAIERAEETWYGEGDYETPRQAEVPASYVTRYPRERAPAYLRRVRTATYSNFVAPIVREYAGHLWKVAPQRSGGAELERFWGDSDGQGMKVDDWMRLGTRGAQIFGWRVALVDRPAGDLSAAEARTFARWLEPEELVDWAMEAPGRFAWARLCSVVTERDPWTCAVTERRVYTTWTATSWRRQVVARTSEGQEVLLDDTGDVPHALGRVPLVILYWSEPAGVGALYGASQVDSTVGLTLEYFNVKAELREWERGQNFGILCVQSDDVDVLQKIRVGVHGGLRVEMGAAMPAFAAPPAAVGQHLVSRLEGLAAAIYATANLERATGTQSGAEVSGVSRAYEFAARTQTQLIDFARRAEAFERELAGLVNAWAGVAEDTALRIAYAQTFDVTGLAERLRIDFDVLAHADVLVPEVSRGARERLARALDPDAPPDRMRATETAIALRYESEAAAFEAKYAKAPPTPPPIPTPPPGTAPGGAPAKPAGDGADDPKDDGAGGS